MAVSVSWFNDQHRHSGIQLVTPSQCLRREAVAISCHLVRVYKQARQFDQSCWSRSIRRWIHPEVTRINSHLQYNSLIKAMLVMVA